MKYDYIKNGDSYQLIKEIDDNSIDLIIIDPPYEMVNGGSGGCFGSDKRNYHNEYKTLGFEEHKRNGLYIPDNDNLKSNCICPGFDYSLLDELDRIMKKTNIYIWCNKNQVSSLMKHYEDLGCNVDLLVWCKTNPIPTCNNKYLSDVEYCVFAREKNTKLYGTYDTKHKYYVSSLNVKDKKLYGHPTIKPLNIIENFIINSSTENDVVLDCFMGSGTTCVAAKKLNRHYIGFELDENYFETAKKRINDTNTKINELIKDL